MPEPLKNMFNADFIRHVIEAFEAVDSDFESQRFSDFIFDASWENRELKDRIRHISHAMRHILPENYASALAIIRQAAAHVPAHYTFTSLIFPDFVECYGLDYPDISIPALEQFTQQSSAEFAIRPFIVRNPEALMSQMLAWTQHESHHVRRLASEGCRPRLPWGIALSAFKKNPAPIIPILEALKADESDYVRRSVANNLNDITKDNPNIVIDLLKTWRESPDAGTQGIIRHALRGLIKQGHPEALAILGYSTGAIFEVTGLTVDPAIVPSGGMVTFSFNIESHSDKPQNLMVDYRVHHMKANGQLQPKTFKLTRCELLPGGFITLTKKHSFRPVTTRRYYPGEHLIEIQINGQLCGQQKLILNV